MPICSLRGGRWYPFSSPHTRSPSGYPPTHDLTPALPGGIQAAHNDGAASDQDVHMVFHGSGMYKVHQCATPFQGSQLSLGISPYAISLPCGGKRRSRFHGTE